MAPKRYGRPCAWYGRAAFDRTAVGIALLGAGVIARFGLALMMAAGYWIAMRVWLSRSRSVCGLHSVAEYDA